MSNTPFQDVLDQPTAEGIPIRFFDASILDPMDRLRQARAAWEGEKGETVSEAMVEAALEAFCAPSSGEGIVPSQEQFQRMRSAIKAALLKRGS